MFQSENPLTYGSDIAPLSSKGKGGQVGVRLSQEDHLTRWTVTGKVLAVGTGPLGSRPAVDFLQGFWWWPKLMLVSQVGWKRRAGYRRKDGG